MAIEISSSQEMLPLSQETFLSMCNSIPEDLKRELFGEGPGSLGNIGILNEPQNASMENNTSFPLTTEPISSVPQQSSLPSTADFPGFFDFSVTIPSNGDISKASQYVYSPLLKRVYIKKDFYCPFNITANAHGPLVGGFYIRAMIYFSSPENINDVVVRCVNHKHVDRENGDPLHEHLLQCNSRDAQYFKDSATKRCSVTVPFENPPIGQDFSSYLYKFKCFTSCSGGPNRRPMCIVFTLENKGYIMGQRKIDLKVCSCPFRDKNIEEKKATVRGVPSIGLPSGSGGNLRENSNPQISNYGKDVSAPSDSSLSDITNDCRPAAKSPVKRKHEEVSGGCKFIKTHNEEEYRFLKGVQKWFQIVNYTNTRVNWVPSVADVANLFSVLTTNSESED